MFGVQRLIESMNKANVDVVVYPTWSNPPRLIGDYFSADGAHCGPCDIWDKWYQSCRRCNPCVGHQTHKSYTKTQPACGAWLAATERADIAR